MEFLSRMELLYGPEAMRRLRSASVIIFGIGGVGGYVAEALARCGVGRLALVDHDIVSESNINRQIIALHGTVNRLKTEVMRERIADISPETQVSVHSCFYLPETRDLFDFSEYDYVVDAVDTVTAKLDIIMAARAALVPVVSAMGAGNKTRPELFEIADIYETSVCPLAKVMRRELKRRGVDALKVVYSKEPPRTPVNAPAEAGVPSGLAPGKRSTPGSVAFCPSVAGLLMASVVVNELSGVQQP